jgi:hypothetical protein
MMRTGNTKSGIGPIMTIWNDSAISLDDIRAIADQIESQKPKGPRIDERTQIWATLTVFAIDLLYEEF